MRKIYAYTITTTANSFIATTIVLVYYVLCLLVILVVGVALCVVVRVTDGQWPDGPRRLT